MEVKITLFAFGAAWIVFLAKAAANYADKDGMIRIKTPKTLITELKEIIKKWQNRQRNTSSRMKNCVRLQKKLENEK